MTNAMDKARNMKVVNLYLKDSIWTTNVMDMVRNMKVVNLYLKDSI
jgi:hypothetical protein